MRMMLLVVHVLNGFGSFLPQLGLRAILAYEFWKAGYTKFTGENWFVHIQDKFPFPFDQIPVELSWALATWTEMLGAVALLLGLATRFFSFSLIILLLVAIIGAHLPDATEWSSLKELWEIAYHHRPMRNGNYGFELPLLYLLMLLPLFFQGAGKLSLDALIFAWVNRQQKLKQMSRIPDRY